jgi:hypothetical protein
MIVLKATATQKKNLEGIYEQAELRFVQDANGNWVVNDAVLIDNNFIEIRTQLEKLQKINYKPILEENAS